MLYKNKKQFQFFRRIKYALIFMVLATAFIVLYYMIDSQDSKISHNISSKEENSKSEPSVSFKASFPFLTGVNLEQGPYYIKSREMKENDGYVSFIEPKAKIMLKHVDWINLTSDTAKLIRNNNHLLLFDNVVADFNKKYYFKSNIVEIIQQDSKIKSDIYSKFFSDEHNIESDKGFSLDYENQIILFNGKINAQIKNPKDKNFTNIKSNELTIYGKEKKGNFLGNVVLTKDGATLKSDKMVAFLDASNKLDKIYVYGNVKIEDKSQVATGEYGEYFVKNSKLVLKEKVTLFKDGNSISGELLNYNIDTKKADLIGSKKDSSTGRVKAIITSKKKYE